MILSSCLYHKAELFLDKTHSPEKKQDEEENVVCSQCMRSAFSGTRRMMPMPENGE